MTWGADPWGAAPAAPTAAIVALAAAAASGALVWVAEIEAARNGGTAPTGGTSWGGGPWGAPQDDFAPGGGIETLRVSDLGWRSRDGDPGGVQPYPPYLLDGPDVERRVALAPGSADTMAWGSLRLAREVSLVGTDTALRRVRIRVGRRSEDPARGYATDPLAAALVEAFGGVALTWLGDVDGAIVPLRDPAAWLDAPLTARRFLGTGGAEGPADLAGTAFPVVRGGTPAAPVRSVPCILVDATKRIYRWTDGPGTLLAPLQAGAAVFTNAGDVADPQASGSPGAGSYYSSNATGQFRLGSDPVGQITADGYGGGGVSAAAIVGTILSGLGIPAGLVDATSIALADAAAPWISGFAWAGDTTARAALAPLLAGINGRLVASRGGALRLLLLRAPSAALRPVTTYDASRAVNVTAVPLGAPLTPPAAAWSVGWGRTHTVNQSPGATVTNPAERERLAREWRTASWSDPANAIRYAQPGRPPLVETALLDATGAASLAAVLGALWGVPRALWRVEGAPEDLMAHDLGDAVGLLWNADGLRDGVVGVQVGDGLRAADATGAALVLT